MTREKWNKKIEYAAFFVARIIVLTLAIVVAQTLEKTPSGEVILLQYGMIWMSGIVAIYGVMGELMKVCMRRYND